MITDNPVPVILAFIGLAGMFCIAVWAWWEARFAARYYLDRWQEEMRAHTRLRRNCVRRDPKTGRYLKDWPK